MLIPTDIQLSKYYQNIVDCPLSKFIEVSTSGNLYALVISGKPTDEELLSAWDMLLEQYADAIGNSEQQLASNLFKQIKKLENTIKRVEFLVKALEKVYCGKFVTLLNEALGTTFFFDAKDAEDYDKKLQRCINLSKGFKLQLDLKTSQFAEMQKKDKGEVMTKEGFYSVLITLSDFAKYPVQDSISVFEYAERIKRINAYITKMESQNK